MMAENRPNVVAIVVDGQKANSLPLYGFPVVQTPHRERLAAEGVLFQHAYATCSKSHKNGWTICKIGPRCCKYQAWVRKSAAFDVLLLCIGKGLAPWGTWPNWLVSLSGC